MNAVKYSQFQLSRIGQKNRCKNGHASMNFWTTQLPETISHHLGSSIGTGVGVTEIQQV